MLPLTIALVVLLVAAAVLLVVGPSTRVRREARMDPRTRARLLAGEEDDAEANPGT